MLLTAAREMIDGPNSWVGRAINTQTWDLVLDQFPDQYRQYGSGQNYRETGFYPPSDPRYQGYFPTQPAGVIIPLPPLQSVVSVTYLDSDSISQTMPSTDYVVVPGEPSRLVLAATGTWPSASWVRGSIKVRFTAGYGDAGSDVPQRIRMAIAVQASRLRSLVQQDLFLTGQTVVGVGSETRDPKAGDMLDGAAKALLEEYRVWT